MVCIYMSQAWGYIAITSYLDVVKFAYVHSQGFGLLLPRCTIIACPTSWPYTLRSFVRSRLPLTCSIKPCSCVITRKLCGCDDTYQDIFFFWWCGISVNLASERSNECCVYNMEQVLDWRYNTIIDGVVVTKKVSLSFHRLQVRKVKIWSPITNSLLDCTFEKMTSLPIQTPWSSGSNEDGIRKLCI